MRKKEFALICLTTCVQFGIWMVLAAAVPRIVAAHRRRRSSVPAAVTGTFVLDVPLPLDDGSKSETLESDGEVLPGFGTDDYFIGGTAAVDGVVPPASEEDASSCPPPCSTPVLHRFVTDKTIYDGNEDEAEPAASEVKQLTTNQQMGMARAASRSSLPPPLDSRSMTHVRVLAPSP